MAETLTLVNAFEVPPDQAPQFIAAWETTRDYLSSRPGYIDTTLHQASNPDTGFQFVNIAHWNSADDFAAAAQSQGFRSAAAALTQYQAHPGLYRAVRD